MISLTHFPPPVKDISVNGRIKTARTEFFRVTGASPTKLFISVDLMEMFLAEFLPMATFVSIEPPEKRKNQIDGMDVYHIVEPNIIECGL